VETCSSSVKECLRGELSQEALRAWRLKENSVEKQTKVNRSVAAHPEVVGHLAPIEQVLVNGQHRAMALAARRLKTRFVTQFYNQQMKMHLTYMDRSTRLNLLPDSQSVQMQCCIITDLVQRPICNSTDGSSTVE
jgi:hypothetical protein